MLVYGPPGTGKSYLLKYLIPAFGLEVIFEGNSASFIRSYHGQGKEMLRHIFNQARLIPWQPCAINIGEVEVLVPDKKSASSSSSTSEITNYLLDSMDGNLQVPSCKVWATTNHVDNIEKAILRRFVPFYLGLFTPDARLKWIA
jgi:ATP-dependent 26S proteasome regulatory subunit